MNRKIIEIINIGPVLFERSNRAKYISINVKSSSKIRVAVPKGISFKMAYSFVLSKTKWIQKNLQKIKTQPKIQLLEQTIDINEGKKFLKNRLKELSIEFGFKYNKVTIRNQRTRWGSCSINNNISLNIKLMGIPKYLCDYVILHELVHTKVKNHSSHFWNTLEQYVENAKVIDKSLKKYTISY